MKTLAATTITLALAAAQLGADDIPGFTWKGKPNFPGYARGMTLGPDRNLWLTDADANAIGRVAQDGTVVDDYKLGTYTSFPVPTANSFPVAITAGPDGALWFVETNNGGKIGRCTTNGAIAEFPLPGPSNGFPGIATGPDGNLWLSASPYDGAHPARILKVTTEGAATAFPLAAGVSAGNLVGGPDGNLWFVERNATLSGIGRITPDGVITDFWLTAKNTAMDITLGQDGNLWFTESNANAIGRITTDGVITEFSIPTPNAYPWGIASGVDGNIWFTEYDAKKIGQLVVASATDQGLATFYDSGSWTFSKPVQLISVRAPSSPAPVGVAVRGARARAAAANRSDEPECEQPVFEVRTAGSGNGNAEEFGASFTLCTDLLVYDEIEGGVFRDGRLQLSVHGLNRGPADAKGFRAEIRVAAAGLEITNGEGLWGWRDYPRDFDRHELTCTSLDPVTLECIADALPPKTFFVISFAVSGAVTSYELACRADSETHDVVPNNSFKAQIDATNYEIVSDQSPGDTVSVGVRGHPR